MNAAEWNRNNQPGIDVVVTLDDGSCLATKTRSVAWELGSGVAVVNLQGKTGGYALDRVRPLITGDTG